MIVGDSRQGHRQSGVRRYWPSEEDGDGDLGVRQYLGAVLLNRWWSRLSNLVDDILRLDIGFRGACQKAQIQPAAVSAARPCWKCHTVGSLHLRMFDCTCRASRSAPRWATQPSVLWRRIARRVSKSGVGCPQQAPIEAGRSRSSTSPLLMVDLKRSPPACFDHAGC
jgi:hypothetical protein